MVDIKSMHMIFLGAPGVGKGTMAQLLAKQFNLVHISSGEIFRAEVAAGTKLGLSIKTAMENGSYIDDEITNAVVLKVIRAAEAKKQGFILDGYPRTINQVQFLESTQVHIDKAVVLKAPTNVLIERLLARGRTDDTEVTIKRRLEIYETATQPLIKHYESRKLVLEVASRGLADESYRALLLALGAHD